TQHTTMVRETANSPQVNPDRDFRTLAYPRLVNLSVTEIILCSLLMHPRKMIRIILTRNCFRLIILLVQRDGICTVNWKIFIRIIKIREMYTIPIKLVIPLFLEPMWNSV